MLDTQTSSHGAEWTPAWLMSVFWLLSVSMEKVHSHLAVGDTLRNR